MYSNVITAIDKIHMYLLHFNKLDSEKPHQKTNGKQKKNVHTPHLEAQLTRQPPPRSTTSWGCQPLQATPTSMTTHPKISSSNPPLADSDNLSMSGNRQTTCQHHIPRCSPCPLEWHWALAHHPMPPLTKLPGATQHNQAPHVMFSSDIGCNGHGNHLPDLGSGMLVEDWWLSK